MAIRIEVSPCTRVEITPRSSTTEGGRVEISLESLRIVSLVNATRAKSGVLRENTRLAGLVPVGF